MIRSRGVIAVLSCLAIVLFPKVASAFCGFYVSGADAKLFNDATQVALMRDGTRTALAMQNSYKGPPENFAMVVPVPVVLQKENVKTLKKELFDKLDKLSAPRLVEYWEQDPCAPPPMAILHSEVRRGAISMPGMAPQAPGSLGVKIEAQFTVGEYEIVILSAKNSGGLDTWLRQEKYKIPEGAEPFFRPYVAAGSKFFVAKVDAKKVSFASDGSADLSPLRFHYDTNEFSLPVRLGLINSSGTQDLIIHILGKNQRYEPANYPSVTIPTNLDVTDTAKDKFGSFYASLFDKTLEKNPKAIVTEYAWDASTCDPCPGPTLDANDFASLGADVMPSSNPNAAKAPPTTKGPPPPVPLPSPMPMPAMAPWGSGGWTLTRLHARYSKDTLGADITFKAATPIVGGREFRGANGALENSSQPAPMFNNFQGRYAVRHAWSGPIACANPRRGVWGGPPAWMQSRDPSALPRAATKSASAPRGADLAMSLRSDVPELDIKATGALPSGASPAPDLGQPNDAGASPLPPPSSADASATIPAVEPKSGGCTCTAVTSSSNRWSDLAPFGVGAAIMLSMLRKRRRG